MTLPKMIQTKFDRSFELYGDLIDSLPPESLGAKLPNLRSNTIGAQLWCVVGARESYARAIVADAWQGFACSLEEPGVPARVAAALESSAELLRPVLTDPEPRSESQISLILDLLEHEAAHQGQLIRYLYALSLEIPASWAARYALEA